MFYFSRNSPPSRDEVIEFIKSLPANMRVVNRSVQFEPAWIEANSIDDPIRQNNMRPCRVEIVFEVDYSQSTEPGA